MTSTWSHECVTGIPLDATLVDTKTTTRGDLTIHYAHKAAANGFPASDCYYLSATVNGRARVMMGDATR